jgi:hypothetical protein
MPVARTRVRRERSRNSRVGRIAGRGRSRRTSNQPQPAWGHATYARSPCPSLTRATARRPCLREVGAGCRDGPDRHRQPLPEPGRGVSPGRKWYHAAPSLKRNGSAASYCRERHAITGRARAKRSPGIPFERPKTRSTRHRDGGGGQPELGAANTPRRSMRERYEASRAARRRRFSSAVALRARSAGVARASEMACCFSHLVRSAFDISRITRSPDATWALTWSSFAWRASCSRSVRVFATV